MKAEGVTFFSFNVLHSLLLCIYTYILCILSLLSLIYVCICELKKNNSSQDKCTSLQSTYIYVSQDQLSDFVIWYKI